MVDVDNKVVSKLPLINMETPLVGLVSDTVSYSGAKHHLVAVHVVMHYVLQLWHESVGVDDVEVDAIVCGNLDTLVAFNEVNETSNVKFVVLPPFNQGLGMLTVPQENSCFVLLILRDFEFFEEENLGAASCDKSSFIEHVHLA